MIPGSTFTRFGSRSVRIATSLGLGLMVTFASVGPSSAFVGPGASFVPAGHALANQTEGSVTDVAFRGRGFGGRGGFGRGGFRRGGFARGGRGFGGRRFGGRGYGYRRGYGGGGVGAGLAGLAVGAVIGGAIASSQAAVPAGNAVAYCESRFRSYNAATGTYRGYDGLDHACP